MQFRIQIKRTRKRTPPARLIGQYKKDVKNTLKKIGRKGVENIRHELEKRNLIKTGETYDSVRYKTTKQGFKFIAEGAAPYLEKGVRRHQMKYLTKSFLGPNKKPIPIDVANAVFRWASPKSMREGKCVHPGFRRGRNFMSMAVKQTRKDMDSELKKVANKIFKF